MKAGLRTVCVLACVVGCSNTEAEAESNDTTGEQTSTSGDVPPSTSTSPSTTTSSTSGSVSPSSSSGEPEGSSTSAAEESGEASTGSDEPDANGCPAGAPDSWVMCEDFDAIENPATDLSQWNVPGDRFGVEADETSDPDDQVLRMSLIPGGGTFGGWVTLRFGDGPEAPAVDSPEGRYDEIWLRYRLRTAGDWPGHTAGDIGEIIAMNGENWGLAADLNLYSDGQFRMHPRAWSCIFNGEQACDGQNDWGGTIQSLWSTASDYVLTGADTAGQWQCIEARMRLNDTSATDGEAEVWVNGEQVFERQNIDWRGTWDEYGINAIRFTNYANLSGDQQLDFFIDDVVAGTERVGCGE